MGLAARMLFKLERRGAQRLEKLVTAAQALARKGKAANFVKVGLLGSGAKRDDGALTNVEIGIIHEFGAPEAGIPERSFLRSTAARNRAEYMALLAKLAKKFYGEASLDGMRKALALVGQRASADVKKHITAGEPIPPPNTPEVFLRKLKKNEEGFNRTGLAPRTLVDTGRMVNSISYEVVLAGAPSAPKKPEGAP